MRGKVKQRERAERRGHPKWAQPGIDGRDPIVTNRKAREEGRQLARKAVREYYEEASDGDAAV